MEVTKAEELTLTEMIQARNIGEVLEKKYPGWLWLVRILDGVAMIHSLRLSGKHGFVLHVDQIDNDYKKVMQAGGEMLERYGFSRGPYNHEKWLNTPMLADGNLKGDIS